MPELRLRGGEVDGLDLHYLVEGRGPAVVLVHGLGGFAESWRHTLRGLGALLPRAGPRGGRLLRRLRIRGAARRRGARGVPRHAPPRADGLRSPRGGLPPRDRHPRPPRPADPRPPGPRRAVGALRAGRRRLRARDGPLGGRVRALPPDRAGRDREPLARGLPGRAARAPLSGDRHGRHHAARPESATGPERPAPAARRAPGLGDAALPPRQLGAHPDRGDRGQGGRAQFRRRDRRLLPSGRAERGGRRLPAPARLQERDEPRRGPRSLGADGRPDHAPVLSVGLLPRAAPGSPFGATPLGPLRARSKPGRRLAAGSGLHVERARVAVWCTLDRPPLNLLDPGVIHAVRAAFDAVAADRATRVAGLTRRGRAFTAGTGARGLARLAAAGAVGVVTAVDRAIDAAPPAPRPGVAAGDSAG